MNTDALTPNGKPLEYKPNTPSGRKAGAKQLKGQGDAAGKKGTVVYYEPESEKLISLPLPVRVVFPGLTEWSDLRRRGGLYDFLQAGGRCRRVANISLQDGTFLTCRRRDV